MSALLVNLFVNFMGTLPTIRKAYCQPETENRLAWAMFSAGNLLNLLAVEEWVFEQAIYPAALALFVGAVTVLVWTPGRRGRFRVAEK